MTATALTRKVVFEMPSEVPDGAGGAVRSWVPRAELWADVKARRSSDRAVGAVPARRVPFDILVRAAPEGTARRPRPGGRFVLGARRFRILSVAETGPRARYLRCDCDEEVTP